LGCKDAEISIVVVDDAEITRLNRRYFRHQGPTNVISFPLQEGKPGNLQAPLLGDVVISADTAARHARAARIRTGDEILFLLVHGVLHLVGYDHEGPVAGRREMEAKEMEIFEALVKRLRRKVRGPRG
jgi:probable rRNA maturation factor